jgi:hypothetical protein
MAASRCRKPQPLLAYRRPGRSELMWNKERKAGGYSQRDSAKDMTRPARLVGEA